MGVCATKTKRMKEEHVWCEWWYGECTAQNLDFHSPSYRWSSCCWLILRLSPGTAIVNYTSTSHSSHTCAFMGIPFDQVMEEEKCQTRFVDGSTQYVGASQKWNESGAALKDSDEGKSEHWRLYLIIHFVWEERWLEKKVFMDSWIVVNNVSGWSTT